MLWLYKSRTPRLIKTHLGALGFAPLSRQAIEACAGRAEMRAAALDYGDAFAVIDLDARCAALELATTTVDGQRLGGFSDLAIADVVKLSDAWLQIQVDSCPDFDGLAAHIELCVAADGDDDGVIEARFHEHASEAVGDVFRAENAERAADFYGEAAIDLSDGQLCYFLACRSVYAIAYGNPDEQRVRSRRWLEQKARKLSRSGSTYQAAA